MKQQERPKVELLNNYSQVQNHALVMWLMMTGVISEIDKKRLYGPNLENKYTLFDEWQHATLILLQANRYADAYRAFRDGLHLPDGKDDIPTVIAHYRHVILDWGYKHDLPFGMEPDAYRENVCDGIEHKMTPETFTDLVFNLLGSQLCVHQWLCKMARMK